MTKPRYKHARDPGGPLKWCPRCNGGKGAWLPRDNKHFAGRKRLSGFCKTCLNARLREYRKTDQCKAAREAYRPIQRELSRVYARSTKCKLRRIALINSRPELGAHCNSGQQLRRQVERGLLVASKFCQYPKCRQRRLWMLRKAGVVVGWYCPRHHYEIRHRESVTTKLAIDREEWQALHEQHVATCEEERAYFAKRRAAATPGPSEQRRLQIEELYYDAPVPERTMLVKLALLREGVGYA